MSAIASTLHRATCALRGQKSRGSTVLGEQRPRRTPAEAKGSQDVPAPPCPRGRPGKDSRGPRAGSALLRTGCMQEAPGARKGYWGPTHRDGGEWGAQVCITSCSPRRLPGRWPPAPSTAAHSRPHSHTAHQHIGSDPKHFSCPWTSLGATWMTFASPPKARKASSQCRPDIKGKKTRHPNSLRYVLVFVELT